MPDGHHPCGRVGADDSFRRVIEALGPGQAGTASVLWLLGVILLMLHGEMMAGTQPAPPSSHDETRS
jgi:hypothetical protein